MTNLLNLARFSFPNSAYLRVFVLVLPRRNTDKGAPQWRTFRQYREMFRMV